MAYTSEAYFLTSEAAILIGTEFNWMAALLSNIFLFIAAHGDIVRNEIVTW
jgi:hypothetical protein